LPATVLGRHFGGHQGAESHAHQGAAALAVLAQPVHAEPQVLLPARPGRVVEFARTVSGAVRVQHQRAEAFGRKGLRLQRHHRTAAVHFFGEGGHHQHIASGRRVVGRRVVEADQGPALTVEDDRTHLASGISWCHGSGPLVGVAASRCAELSPSERGRARASPA
jgi:hypothetical protein